MDFKPSNMRARHQMIERKTSVADLTINDLLHAAFPNEAMRICIVMAVEERYLTARAITTQEIFRFDRRSGTSVPSEADDAVCTIDSVVPLAHATRDALLGYDLRCRTSKEPDAGRLTVDERQALLDAGQLYAANPVER